MQRARARRHAPAGSYAQRHVRSAIVRGPSGRDRRGQNRAVPPRHPDQVGAPTADDRVPVLDLMGPLTVKEVESLVFVAARNLPQLEACHRTWLEDDRSYFVRWREEHE